MYIAQQIANELEVKVGQIEAAIKLLDEGATVPFIARYRKEVTQGLTDTHLRALTKQLDYLRSLEDRRQLVLTTIEQQGKLTDSLKQQILAADNKTRLEDLYLPFRPKRQTKGQKAIDAGLAPLAEQLFQQRIADLAKATEAYVDAAKGYASVEDVIDGTSAILAEQFAVDADLLAKLRKLLITKSQLTSSVVKSKQQQASKFKDYFDHSEAVNKVPAHRALAMFRGKSEGFLQLKLQLPQTSTTTLAQEAEQLIAAHYRFDLCQASGESLTQVIHYAWKQKLESQLTSELLGKLREQAEQDSIIVFANNLKDVLMAAPAGEKITMGIDPGLRTGCKIAIVDSTAKLLHTATIYPHAPQNNWDKSMRTLVNLVRQYKVQLIAVGNGTGSRETDKLASEVISQIEQNKPSKVMVSEAGASVYSASEFAANELPELDVSLRGAVSIARRLQDPLAELVKIDPKAIGVGQYQHDVSQSQLTTALDNVVEDCVNAVGVDLNSASPALLARVAGLSKTIAQNIVDYREQHGRFNDRQSLINVPRLGAKAFEQSAGFLRIREGGNPLDASAVHPESYSIVDAIAAKLSTDVANLVGNHNLLQQIDAKEFVNEHFGELTLNDIKAELEKPSRDPRPEFKTATFRDGVNSISDLAPGMIMEGVISNVANFGAFVDIGVHQDGLVHISSMTNKFISDPREIVKAGDVVKVKVTEVDIERKRISLTMKLDDAVEVSQPAKPVNKPSRSSSTNQVKNRAANKKVSVHSNAAMGNAFADAFAKLKK